MEAALLRFYFVWWVLRKVIWKFCSSNEVWFIYLFIQWVEYIIVHAFMLSSLESFVCVKSKEETFNVLSCNSEYQKLLFGRLGMDVFIICDGVDWIVIFSYAQYTKTAICFRYPQNMNYLLTCHTFWRARLKNWFS